MMEKYRFRFLGIVVQLTLVEHEILNLINEIFVF